MNVHNIKHFKLNFASSTARNEKVFEGFHRLIEKFNNAHSLELTGTLAELQIVRLLNSMPNCEILNLNNFIVGQE
jgi:hypothetical protein